MRRVILESPYAGNIVARWLNRRYARACLHHSLMMGEAPIASHLLYTQALDDGDAHERKIGVDAGLAWLGVADASVVYIDRGLSDGMRQGIAAAQLAGVKVEFRALGMVTRRQRQQIDRHLWRGSVRPAEPIGDAERAELRAAMAEFVSASQAERAADAHCHAVKLAHNKTRSEQGGASC
jgi:hypothetical protein